jgi:hypothetical protein
MPITLNHSNIGVQYSSDKSYIIETVKSDLYVRNEIYDNIIRDNIQVAPVTPTTYVDSGNVYAVESYTYSGSANTADFTRVFTKNTTCDILVVGGGGAGGRRAGGGGGAGALIYHKNQILNGTYNIKVGKGGRGVFFTEAQAINNGRVNVDTSGYNGEDSQFIKSDNTKEYLAKGGGGGIGGGSGRGGSGGSAGGGSYSDTVSSPLLTTQNKFNNSIVNIISNSTYDNTGLTYPEGCYGRRGGIQVNLYKGGGGGGAGGAGMNHAEETTVNDGYGGLGLAIDITGKSVIYAGGGNGSDFQGTISQVFDPAYPTIQSRGGGGFASDNGIPQNGLDGTGGGGGGQGNDTQTSGAGGSGIVIIRYLLGTIPANNILTTEPTIDSNIPRIVSGNNKTLNLLYYPVVDTNNLLVHYKFDDFGSGEGYLDSSGNGYHLTARIGDTPIFTSTKNVAGTSAYENGTSGSGLVIPNTLGSQIATVNNNSGISISFWFNLTISANWADVVCFMYNTSDYRGIIIGQPPNSDNFFVGIQNGAKFPYGYITKSGGLFNNIWHHFVWMIDTYGNWNIYIDNALQIATGASDVLFYKIPNYAYNINSFFAGSQSNHNNGYIDDFRIYKKILSNTEIATLYNINSGVANTYTLNFPVPTVAYINNNSNLILEGTYNISVSPTTSSVLPTASNKLSTIPLQNTTTSNIIISYNLLNPLKDPVGAQWTYSSNNTNVYHMGSVGIGTTRPEYQLDVRGAIYSSIGGYTQTGLTTWSITSDRRIKENITRASYDICLENVKNIELYNFNFKNNCVNTNDKHQLGFIAQEVQQVYPKAVEVGKMILNTNEEINDILTLNTTQIDYTLYGAVKNLIEKIEDIDNDLENIEKLI